MADWRDLPPILDAAQVADLLGMNVQMVRRYAREGRLPAYKIPGGRTFRFITAEIIEFLKAHPAVMPEAVVADAAEEPKGLDERD